MRRGEAVALVHGTQTGHHVRRGAIISNRRKRRRRGSHLNHGKSWVIPGPMVLGLLAIISHFIPASIHIIHRHKIII